MERSSDCKKREINLLGSDKVEYLSKRSVAVFGLGGVGSYCAEALCRAGVGKLLLCDGDVVDETNINRQLFALFSTVGRPKCEIAKERLTDINPDVEIVSKFAFFEEKTLSQFDLSGYDYIVDCVDRVSAKLLLAETCKALDKSIIACLGTGNKLDNTAFKVSDIFKTKICPLAKVMRRELKKRGIERLKVVYSEEEPRVPFCEDKRTPASVSFVPPVAGLIVAGEVIKDLLKGV